MCHARVPRSPHFVATWMLLRIRLLHINFCSLTGNATYLFPAGPSRRAVSSLHNIRDTMFRRFYIMTDSPVHQNHLRHMMMRFNRDYDRRRRADQIPFELEEPTVQPLGVEFVEFYPQNNAVNHHTDQFELVTDSRPTPVLRRGQSFHIAIRFDREVDLQQDSVRLIFNYGPKPAVNKGTKVILPLEQREEISTDSRAWDAKISQLADDRTMSIEVQPSVSCPVGIWKVIVQTSSSGNDKKKDHTCKEDVYILFNPWHKDDGVYMADEEERNEYILKDVGKVYMGTHLKPRGRRWIFGQFDDVVLPTVMYLLEKSMLQYTERGNPVQIARAISAVVNSNDDNGLLEGRWDGNYDDGVSPFAWTGSVAIMEKYLKSGGVSVKYGQCWVFSAATVTVCRALGIPCRAVTNYVSAHDTNRSLTLDKYFSTDGEEIEGGPDGECYDSCWNFHVWTDVWMSRPDLPQGYGGWQIIDATPQEPSQDMFRCGPASVEAVRKGDVGFAYDTPFAFAEVNADICHFQEDENSVWGFSRLRLNQYHVGKLIVTKKVGVDLDEESTEDIEDITGLYKNPEGSQAERLAVFNAVRGVEKAQLYYDFPSTPVEDVAFDLKEIDTIPYGEEFKVEVSVENNAEEDRTVTAVLSASSVYYTGATAHRLKKAQGTFTLPPGGTETLVIQIPSEDYIHKLVDHNLIKIYAIANVTETKQTWSEEDDFPFEKPPLDISVEGELKVGQKCSATFTFKNPLDTDLSDCIFSVEGPGLQRPKLMRIPDIKAQEEISLTEDFFPKLSGERKIVGTLNTKPLAGMSGSSTVVILE